ncbi:MAG TPA: beta-ketoacyl-[acyl-carrier-protein] synthase family protein [Puia sp.]|nr:beta-ketoacyl-[acyl-carrier-protein] synthase family protein [Puia sp.]
MGRVFITGMGAISAIGDDVAENHTALIQGRCGITVMQRFSSRYSGLLPFGEIHTGTDELKESLKVSDAGVTRTSLLALHAFREAISDAGLTLPEISSSDTALVGATTVGGICLTDELYRDANSKTGSSPFYSSYDCASVNLYLQDHYKLNGMVNTINTACSSSANAIMYGARLIKNGLTRKAIVGGADSLAKFTINGFNALQILSPEVCMPFDQNRKGLNLGEGAAFLILEREEDLAGKKVYAELTGYFNSNDAFHPSSLSEEGDGPFLAMKGALDSARLDYGQIDFINAHGTSTENNDEAESRAMIRLFGEPPPFASTKSNTGHTLGASGALEAAYSILNLEHQEIYAGLNFKQPMATTGLRPVQVYKKIALTHVMSNSFGFGGNCTSLIFSKAC